METACLEPVFFVQTVWDTFWVYRFHWTTRDKTIFIILPVIASPGIYNHISLVILCHIPQNAICSHEISRHPSEFWRRSPLTHNRKSLEITYSIQFWKSPTSQKSIEIPYPCWTVRQCPMTPPGAWHEIRWAAKTRAGGEIRWGRQATGHRRCQLQKYHADLSIIYPLVNVYIANWKMAIEIVDFPIENDDFL